MLQGYSSDLFVFFSTEKLRIQPEIELHITKNDEKIFIRLLLLRIVVPF